jgi:hypothetical protein
VSNLLKDSFDTSPVEKHILLPANIHELVESNYLVRLYIHCVSTEGYTSQVGTQKWVSRLPRNEMHETYLKAFGVLLVSNKVEPLPKNRGMVYKGVAASYHYWLSGAKGIDMSLTKVAKIQHPTDVLIGENSKNYPVEKRMLDHLIHRYRQLELPDAIIDDLMLSTQQVIKDKGLSVKLDSQTLLDAEKVFVEDVFSSMYKVPLNVYSGNFTMGDDLTRESMVLISQGIRDRQKTLRPYKDIYKAITSDRIQAIYAPFKGAAAKKKAAKVPIKTLMTDVRTLHENVMAFNPTRFLTLIGEASVHPVYNPDKELDNKLCLEKSEQLKFAHSSKPYTGSYNSLMDSWLAWASNIVVEHVF